MVDYVTVFEVGDKTNIWWFPIFLMAFFVIGVYTLVRYRNEDFQHASLGWMFVLIGMGGPILALSNYVNLSSHQRALASHNYRVVEGPVQQFQPMLRMGHTMETFEVNGTRFSYSNFVPSECFADTAAYGGPIREGMYVRIAYIDNCILRLEVRR